jgi:hypothetical protein
MLDARSYFSSQAERISAAIGNQRDLGGKQGLVALDSQWERLTAGYKFGAGTGQKMQRGLIRASDAEMNVAVIELLDALAPSIRGAIEAVWLPYFESIRDAWPVKTGRSKDLLSVNVSIKKDSVVAEIGSGAPYTFFIPWGRGKQWVGPTTPGRKFTYSKKGNEKEGKRQLFFYVETPRTDGFKPGRKVWSDLVRNRFDRVKIDFVNAIGSNIAREL